MCLGVHRTGLSLVEKLFNGTILKRYWDRLHYRVREIPSWVLCLTQARGRHDRDGPEALSHLVHVLPLRAREDAQLEPAALGLRRTWGVDEIDTQISQDT